MLDQLGYISPTKIAQQLSEYLTSSEASVLDLGCGTGLTGVYLAAAGYLNLDGIDLSADMIRVAGQRRIYRELVVGDIKPSAGTCGCELRRSRFYGNLHPWPCRSTTAG